MLSIPEMTSMKMSAEVKAVLHRWIVHAWPESMGYLPEEICIVGFAGLQPLHCVDPPCFLSSSIGPSLALRQEDLHGDACKTKFLKNVQAGRERTRM